MKKLWAIKWELIMFILLLVLTIISWSIWETDLNDWRMLVLTLIPTIALIVWIISYSKIRDFRQQIYKMW